MKNCSDKKKGERKEGRKGRRERDKKNTCRTIKINANLYVRTSMSVTPHPTGIIHISYTTPIPYMI